jgi:hypothetical protein
VVRAACVSLPSYAGATRPGLPLSIVVVRLDKRVTARQPVDRALLVGTGSDPAGFRVPRRGRTVMRSSCRRIASIPILWRRARTIDLHYRSR